MSRRPRIAVCFALRLPILPLSLLPRARAVAIPEVPHRAVLRHVPLLSLGTCLVGSTGTIWGTLDTLRVGWGLQAL
eukprot:2346208-Rhodomonas_salina.2